MVRALDMLRFYLGRLGRAGVAGLVMLFAALAYEYAVVLPREAALDAQRLRNEQLRQEAAALRAHELEAALAAGGKTPMAPAATDALRRLFDAAENANLELDRGEYRLTEIREANLRRYQLSLPVTGSYPDIRAFVTEALNADPALALGAISLRRDSIEAAELDAQLSFTLFLGTGA